MAEAGAIAAEAIEEGEVKGNFFSVPVNCVELLSTVNSLMGNHDIFYYIIIINI